MEERNETATERNVDFRYIILIFQTIFAAAAIIAVFIIKIFQPSFFGRMAQWYYERFEKETHIEDVVGSFPASSELGIGEYTVIDE